MSIEKCQREFDTNLWIVFSRKIKKRKQLQETSIKLAAPAPAFYDGTGNI